MHDLITRGSAGLGLLLALAACNGGGTEDQPFFPADYLTTYTEVRNCRQSGDHDLNFVRILTDGPSTGPYQGRIDPIPVGGVVVKEEYEFGDSTCSGDIKQWTVMKRLESGSSPVTLDWTWQQVDLDRNVVGVDTPRCYGCHSGCGTEAQGGYEGTCSQP